MNCPVCREPMLVLELDQVEVDYCTSCRGIWLDGGELELLLGGAAERRLVLASFEVERQSHEKPRKCPLCRKRMEKVLCGSGSAGKVRIDRCFHGDGIWSDGGELEQILEMGSFDQGGRILRLLQSMFHTKTE